jgi:hypothetical protein
VPAFAGVANPAAKIIAVKIAPACKLTLLLEFFISSSFPFGFLEIT